MPDTDMVSVSDAPLSMSEAINALTAPEPEQEADTGQSDADQAQDGEYADEEQPSDEDGEDEGTTDEDDQADEDAGDDEADESEQDDEPGQGRFAADDHRVRMPDGSFVTVAELKQGNLLDRDYRQKTMELAEVRRTVEAQSAEVSQLEQRYTEVTDYAQRLVEAFLPQPPDPSLATSDPARFIRDKASYEQMMGHLEFLKSEKAKTSQEAQAKQAEEARTRANQEWHALTEKMPEFKDPQRRDAIFKRMSSTASEHYGFSEQEVRSALMFDHRQAMVLRDAARWRAAQAKKPAAMQKLEGKPPVQKGGKRLAPGQQQARQARAAMEQLNKSGSLKDGVQALLAIEGKG